MPASLTGYTSVIYNTGIYRLYEILLLYPIAVNHTSEDSLAIKQAALDYMESQPTPDPARMERALHPRLVKRTFGKDRKTGKDYMRETSAECMVLLAETYNTKGVRFPAVPRKGMKFLDVAGHTASIKLIADEWIDYVHLIRLNGSWKIAKYILAI